MELELNKIQLDWNELLKSEFEKDYIKDIFEFLEKEKKNNKTIYPIDKDIFSAFKYCPLKDIKVVIIGQDPYHGENQAHGLAFSVLPGVKIPPSLRNIYKELSTDMNCEPVSHGYLESWAKQGVLLINNILTVEQSLANSHKKIGWQQFTDRVVSILNDQCSGLVFILWGGHAQKKGKGIDQKKHLVIEGHHPSPLSSYKGFFGSKPFSKTNTYLKSINKKPIDWQLPELSKESSGEYTQLSF